MSGRRCFTYGTLMCPQIMAAVCARTLYAADALLTGYRRLAVRGEDYPGIVADPQGRVTGRLYAGIDDSLWQRLDRFEGAQYQRQVVRVRTIDGREVRAETYLFAPHSRALLSDSDWDFEHFLAHGKARFLARYLGFHALDRP